MRGPVIGYLAVLVVMAVLDAVWLSTMVPAVYRPALAGLLRAAPAKVPAVLFYLLYAAGVLVLVVLPALAQGGWRQALWRGAAFGLVAYATYDLTNAATLRDWPAGITLLDMAWGTVLTAVTAAAATAVTRAAGGA